MTKLEKLYSIIENSRDGNTRDSSAFHLLSHATGRGE